MKKNVPNVAEKGVALVHKDGEKRLIWKIEIVKNLITGKDLEVRRVSMPGVGKGHPFIFEQMGSHGLPYFNVYCFKH